MPNIEGYKLTNKGNALQIKVEAGKCKLDITKLKLGSGTASGDIVNLTDLVKVEQTVPISKIEVIDDYTCRITGLVTNQGLNKMYYIREIGLYAQDPDDGEILYLVAVDKNPDVMPADNYQMIISQEFNIDVVVSNVDSVNVTSQPVHLVTSDEVDEKIEEHNTSANPHENIFKRVLITEAKTAANTTDWNTLTESRTYKITGATFAADKHQPVGAVGTGELVVLKNGDDTIVQVYYANSTEFDQAGAFHRIYFGGAWTNWVYDITNQGGTINGNLNVDGNLGVTGNSNINGKLTVDSLDIKNNFTVAGGTPVTGDDLQKVQDQIIAPSQTLYVDQKNGNDDNDGTTRDNAVRSLDKAITLIRQNIPTLNINLITYKEEENKQYNIFNLTDFINNAILQITNINISADYTNYLTAGTVAVINIPYGKHDLNTIDYDSGTRMYSWGYCFIFHPINITLSSIVFNINDDCEDSAKYINAIMFLLQKSFTIQNVDNTEQNLPKNCFFINLFGEQNVDIINFNTNSSYRVEGDGFITTNRRGAVFSTDPKTTDGGINAADGTLPALITKYISRNTTFSANVLGDTKGLSSGIEAIYTQGFD